MKNSINYLSLLLLFISSSSFAATYSIPSSTAPQTQLIQFTIDNASSGDVIFFAAGNHYIDGVINLTKSNLVLFGAGTGGTPSAFLKKTSGNYLPVFAITGSNNRVDRIYIDGGVNHNTAPCPQNTSMCHPGLIISGNDNTVVNSVFRNNGGAGLLLHGAHRTHVEGTKAYYNGTVGISMADCDNSTILNSQAYSNGAEGITVDPLGTNGTDNALIKNVWVHNNNWHHRGVGGIGVDAASGVTFENGLVEYNGNAGITFNNQIGSSDDAVFLNITVRNNQYHDVYERWCKNYFNYNDPIIVNSTFSQPYFCDYSTSFNGTTNYCAN